MLRGEPIWQTRSMLPMSMPSSSEAVATRALQLAVLEPLLDSQAAVARQAAVVARDGLLAEALARGCGRRAPRAGACSRRPASCGGPGSARRGGRRCRAHCSAGMTASRSDGGTSIASVDVALVAEVDDRAVGMRRPRLSRCSRADEEGGDLLDRPLGRGEADAGGPRPRPRCVARRGRGGRGSARGGCRACRGRGRGSRRRSRCGRGAGSRGRARR